MKRLIAALLIAVGIVFSSLLPATVHPVCGIYRVFSTEIGAITAVFVPPLSSGSDVAEIFVKTENPSNPPPFPGAVIELRALYVIDGTPLALMCVGNVCRLINMRYSTLFECFSGISGGPAAGANARRIELENALTNFLRVLGINASSVDVHSFQICNSSGIGSGSPTYNLIAVAQINATCTIDGKQRGCYVYAPILCFHTGTDYGDWYCNFLRLPIIRICIDSSCIEPVAPPPPNSLRILFPQRGTSVATQLVMNVSAVVARTPQNLPFAVHIVDRIIAAYSNDHTLLLIGNLPICIESGARVVIPPIYDITAERRWAGRGSSEVKIVEVSCGAAYLLATHLFTSRLIIVTPPPGEDLGRVLSLVEGMSVVSMRRASINATWRLSYIPANALVAGGWGNNFEVATYFNNPVFDEPPTIRAFLARIGNYSIELVHKLVQERLDGVAALCSYTATVTVTKTLTSTVTVTSTASPFAALRDINVLLVLVLVATVISALIALASKRRSIARY